MSLYIGNLSSRTRRDDLERVFRRFGRNSIQIKNGYGFVVYDVQADANRALRALQGRNICGEKISISWSNNQPKPYQRFTRGSRFGEPYRGRNFARREDFGSRVGASHHEGRFKGVTEEADVEGVGHHMDDIVEKETANSSDADAENGRDRFENVDDSLMVHELPVGSILEDTGRWGEPVSDSSDRREADNGQGIELYERYDGHARIDEGEDRYRPTPHGSFARGTSREKSQKYHIVGTSKHVTDLKDQLKCHNCGLTGHLKRQCPQQDGFRQEKFARLDRWCDRDVSFRDKHGLKKARPESGGQPNLTIKCPPRRSKKDVSSPGSRKLQRYVRDKTSLSAKTRESQRRKNRKRENGNPVKEGRKAGREGSSPRHSDSTASWLRSTSSGTRSYSSLGSRSRSRSRPRSRSQLSSRIHSASSSSRSMTPSSKSRSESSRSQSRSRSGSPASLSLSVSLSQPSRSAYNKVGVEDTGMPPKNYLEEDNKSASNQILIHQRQKKGDEANTEKFELDNTNEDLLDENRSLFIKANDDMNTNHYGQSSENSLHKLDKTGHAVKGPCLDPSEGGMVSINILSSESSGEGKDTQNSDPSKLEETQVSCEKQNIEVPSTVRSKNSTSISSQEMHMVLKHYGLAILDENEQNLSVEEYFGSARLWPWEVIYYRRLKKGPISTENYARRIAQNEEFGIVDKYIRSSSGWGECQQSSW